MAFFEKALGGVVVGFAAGMFGQSILSSAGSVLRPIAKALIAGGLNASERVKVVAAEAMEQVKDLVAEVHGENGSAPTRDAEAPQAKRRHAD